MWYFIVCSCTCLLFATLNFNLCSSFHSIKLHVYKTIFRTKNIVCMRSSKSCMDIYLRSCTWLHGATSYVKLAEGNQLSVGYTSVFIVLVTFIGILAFHIFWQLRHPKLWKKLPKLNLKFNIPNVNNLSMNILINFLNLCLRINHILIMKLHV